MWKRGRGRGTHTKQMQRLARRSQVKHKQRARAAQKSKQVKGHRKGGDASNQKYSQEDRNACTTFRARVLGALLPNTCLETIAPSRTDGLNSNHVKKSCLWIMHAGVDGMVCR